MLTLVERSPAHLGDVRRGEGDRRRERIDRPFDRSRGRVHEDEAAHEARVPARDVERDRAAERMAEEVHAGRSFRQRLDPAGDRVREEPDAVDDALARRLVAPPVAEEVERENAPPPREERQRQRPLAPVGADPVQEDERRRPPGRDVPASRHATVRPSGNREATELQYFLIKPTTTPWTFTSPSAA